MAWKTLGSTMFASLALFCFTGCQESTTPEDVADAQAEVREQERDVAEAKQDRAEAVAEERADEHEAMKPVLEEDADDIQDERADVAEADREGDAAVAEEQKDVEEAKRDLQHTEAELAATQARDEFAAQGDAELKAADEKIAALKERADAAEGAEKDRINAEVERLTTQRDLVEDELDELKSADLAKWNEHQKSFNEQSEKLKQMMEEIQ